MGTDKTKKPGCSVSVHIESRECTCGKCPSGRGWRAAVYIDGERRGYSETFDTEEEACKRGYEVVAFLQEDGCDFGYVAIKGGPGVH